MASKLPFPMNVAQFLLDSLVRPVRSVGSMVCGTLFLLFLATGAILPDAESTHFEDPIEILGSFLLFGLLIPYLLMCLLAGFRSNNATIQQFTHQLPESFDVNRFQLLGWWPLAVAIGVAFAVFGNINWSAMVFDPAAAEFSTSIMLVFGQILLWVVVFLVLFVLAHECWVLGRMGRVVPIDLYRLDEMNGFGQAGLNNFLMVVGALAITTVQSIDQEFRAVNYVNGLLVGIPAALILVSLPIWSLHLRLREAKLHAVAEVDRAIALADKGLASSRLSELNGLLARRDYLKGLRSWPMDLSIFSKLLLYVFIPPLAWVGAALVEFALDSFLAG